MWVFVTQSSQSDSIESPMQHCHGFVIYRYGTFTAGLNENDTSLHWEPGVITYFAYRNRGMSGLLVTFKYSIGYLSISDAEQAGIKYASMVNHFGHVVAGDVTSVQAAMDDTDSLQGIGLTGSLTTYTSPNAYPIAGYTYFIIRLTTMHDCAAALELLRYIKWLLNEQISHDVCVEHNMAPISSKVGTKFDFASRYNLWNKIPAGVILHQYPLDNINPVTYPLKRHLLFVCLYSYVQ